MTDESGPRSRAGIAVAGMLCLAVSLLVSVVVLRMAGMRTTATVAQLTSVALAVASLVVWRRSADTGVTPTTGEVTTGVAAAKQVLAGLVAEQWKAEAAVLSLDHPGPIPVPWPRIGRDAAASDPAERTEDEAGNGDGDEEAGAPGTGGAARDSAARVAAIAERFRTLEPRRLVIAGEPGTGKTTLALRLLLELLESRREDEPVPVLVSLAGWDTYAFPDLTEWLAVRLEQDYPALQATALGGDAPHTLADRRAVLPILDGLDELPEAARAATVAALSRSMADADPLIITGRAESLAEAVAEDGPLHLATIIEPYPLSPESAAGYLEACLPDGHAPGWDRFLARLRDADSAGGPRTAPADTASTALGLWLLRSVYAVPGADPAPLLDSERFPTSAAVRAHLLDELVGAAVAAGATGAGDRDGAADPLARGRTRPYPGPERERPDANRPHPDPDRLRRWLGYLADHLGRVPVNRDHAGTGDFAWFQLAPHALSPRALAVTAGLASGLALALWYGLAGWLAFTPSAGLGIGSAVGLAGGIACGRRASAWSTQSPAYADLRVAGRLPLLGRLVTKNIFKSGLVVGLMFGAGVGLGAGLAGGLVFGLMYGPFGGLAAGLASGLVFGPVIGLAGGLGLGAGIGVIEWVRAVGATGRSGSPMAHWRADRRLSFVRFTVFGLVGGLVAGIWVGSVTGLVFGPPTGFAVGLLTVLVGGPGIGLVTASVHGEHHAWAAYAAATCRLAWRGQLPRRLMRRLDDAHRLGLMRAIGPVYQFRHAALRDHLAAAHRENR